MTNNSKPKTKKVLTKDQRLKLLFSKCKTMQEFYLWTKYHFRVDLPDGVVSRYADISPLGAAWLVYDICVNRHNPENIQELLYVASRGSGKCVKKDTLIQTFEGPKYIQDIKLGDKVWTGWSWKPVIGWFDEGVKDGVTITTNILKKDGCNTLTGSLKHRIQAFDSSTGKIQWRYMKDLQVGDIVYKSIDDLVGQVDIDSNDYWTFINRGYYETVKTVSFEQAYFYDLEVEGDHAYWSNGFISHNTLGMAVAELSVLLHDKRSVVHVGSILTQAKRCYKYQEQFLLGKVMRPLVEPPEAKQQERILQSLNREKSEFIIDNEEVTLEVLPCTLKAVNGPHCPLVVVDEIDTVKGEAVQAFQDIEGMLDTRGDQKALRVGISTRKTRYGLMNQQIEGAELAGRTVKRWTVFEFSKRCSDEESGTKPTLLYIKQDTLEALTEPEWQARDKSRQLEFVPAMFPGEKCRQCSLAGICWGDAKNQHSTSKFLKPLSDARKKVKSNGPDWALAQLVNLKPSVEGIIYREFEERKHVKTWNEMWKILTGTDFPGECTHDLFVRKCHQMKLPCYASMDFGWSNPSTVVFAFIDSVENIYIVKATGMTYMNNPMWIQYIKQKFHNIYRPQMYFIDVANPGDIVSMQMESLPVCDTTAKGDIKSGIQIIKKWLYSLASPEPKLYMVQETCQPLITEFFMYHFKTDAAGEPTDEPEPKFDHWLDALRYMVYGIFGRSQPNLCDTTEDLSGESLTDTNGNFFRTPTGHELAAMHNVDITELQDTSKLGKIVTCKDSGEEENDDFSGSGNFFWSF